MKKILQSLALGGLLLGTWTGANAAWGYPDQIYVPGVMNGWTFEEEWTLHQEDELNPQFFTGTFVVAEGELEFKITGSAEWNEEDWGGYEFEVYSNRPSYQYMSQYGSNMRCTNWQGGPVTLTVNWDNKEITIQAPEQPEYYVPEVLYLVGNFNGWTTPDSSDYSSKGGIILTDYDGDLIYEGDINYSGGNDIQFKILDAATGWGEGHDWGGNWENQGVLRPNEYYTFWMYQEGQDNFEIINFKETAHIRVNWNNKYFNVYAEEVVAPEVYIEKYYDGNEPQLMNLENSDGSRYTISLEIPAMDQNPEFSFRVGSNNYGIYPPYISLFNDQPFEARVNGSGICLDNWQGGELNVTYDWLNSWVMLEAPDQPAYSLPETLYLVGSFNGWVTPSDENYEASGGIILKDEDGDGIFEGRIEYYDSERMSFKFFDRPYDWWQGHYYGGMWYEEFILQPGEAAYMAMAEGNDSYDITVSNWNGTGTVWIDMNNGYIFIECDDPVAPKVYIYGSLTDNYTEELTPSEEFGVYTGEFNIDSNYISFYLFDSQNSYYSPSSNEFIVYSDFPYSVGLEKNYGSWIYTYSWNPGILKVTFNVFTQELTLEGPDQRPLPECLYLNGDFNNWSYNADPAYKLNQVEGSKGVYYGKFTDIPEYEGYLSFNAGYPYVTQNGYTQFQTFGNNYGTIYVFNDYDIETSVSNYGSNWYIVNWKGGEIEFTIDIINGTSVLSSSTQPNSADADVLYMIGDGIYYNKYYTDAVLNPVEGQKGVYEGDFKVFNYHYDAYFRFYNRLGDLFNSEYMIGSPGQQTMVDITSENPNFSGNYAEKSEYYWYLPNWPGFNVKMTVDTNNKTVKYSADFIEEIYLTGSFSNWTTPDSADFSGLVLKDEDGDGIFRGTLEAPGKAVALKLFAEKTNDWNKAYGTYYDMMYLRPESSISYYMAQENSYVNVNINNWHEKAEVSFDWGTKYMSFYNPDVPQPTASEKVYFSGSMNNWSVNDDAYVLNLEESLYDTYGIYKGEFDIPAGEFDFRFVENDVIEIGSDSGRKIAVYNEMPGETWMGYNPYTIKCVNWEGGKAVVTLNTLSRSIKIEGPDQPEESGVLYLMGNMERWNNFSTKYTLYPVEDNVYSGTFDITEETGNGLYFVFFSYLGTWKDAVIATNEESYIDFKFGEDGIYKGSCTIYNFEGRSGNWHLDNWDTGEITFTVDLNNNKVEFIDVYTAGARTLTAENGKIRFYKGVITAQGASSIKVMSVNGQMMAGGNGETLDITNLPKGVYVVVTPEYKPVKIVM